MNHLIELLNMVGAAGVAFYGALFVAALGFFIFDRKRSGAASQSEITEERRAA
jgi:hypothetical protein